jgi:N-acetylglutamate synthase-like GNAT family acetyltransferase
VLIRPLNPADGPACDQVVASLPYFFGNQEGLRRCAHAVRTQRGWVAERSTEVVGFLTVHEPFPRSPEVTWMAISSDERRHGIGRALVERTAAELAADGAELLSVLALGPSVPEPGVTDGYAGTRRFYARCGFTSVMEFRPDGWTDVALLLVRCLRHSDLQG